MQGMYFLQLYSGGCPLKQPSALNFPDLTSLTKSPCGWYNEGKWKHLNDKEHGHSRSFDKFVLAKKKTHQKGS
jgi:hypothetical protein